ncbi:MAG: tetratricopeptide repeat protein [Acidobacteria bacterium]|nr:tetratricopeptide repeat protein [Acidobacteriota bacterium]
MRSQLVRVLPLILLSAIVFAAAAPAQRPSQEDRIRALESKLAALETAQNNALNRLDQMRLNLGNTVEPLRVRLADYGEDMRGVESRLVALEELLALMNERLIDIADGIGASGGAPARQVSGTPMPPPQRPVGVPGPSVARPATSTPLRTEAGRSEADSLYSAAYTDYLSANYGLAIEGFQEYLSLFPDAKLADNAQYWIGESHYSLQQYQLARTAFMEIVRRYPRAETVPDASFKAARCLVELGDATRAINELVRLVGEHPGSDTVPIACMQIERLGGEKPIGCAGN